MSEAEPVAHRAPRRARPVFAAAGLGFAAILPLFLGEGSNVLENMVLAAAYVMMALGLNIVVGFAGLLDLGYVAFFAIGAHVAGWFMSGFVTSAGGGKGFSLLVGEPASNLPGIHFNFLLVILIAIVVTTIAGMLIGLPTLRVRGDYIAIVTLAFGEIVGRLVIKGDEIVIAGEKITNGPKGITPIDKIDLPFLEPLTGLELRPWYWVALALVGVVLFVNYRLRDSRLGRAWMALRDDEGAAASAGIPIVRTKLLAYGVGAALGGVSGEPPPSRQQRLLNEVLGVLNGAEDAVAVNLQLAPAGIGELSKRVLVARARPRQRGLA